MCGGGGGGGGGGALNTTPTNTATHVSTHNNSSDKMQLQHLEQLKWVMWCTWCPPPASSPPAQPHPALHHHLSSPGHQHMDRPSLSHGHMWDPNYTSFNRIKSMAISKSLQVIVSQFVTETL